MILGERGSRPSEGLAQARVSSLKREYVFCRASKGSPKLVDLLKRD